MICLAGICKRRRGAIASMALAMLLSNGQTAATEEQAASPWLANDPIVTVARELYLRQKTPGHGIWAKQYNAGPGLERLEVRSEELSSDVWTNIRGRTSNDNGRTWSDWYELPNNLVDYNGVQVWEGDDMTLPVYDEDAGILVQPFHRIVRSPVESFNCFAYYRLSTDHGRK